MLLETVCQYWGCGKGHLSHLKQQRASRMVALAAKHCFAVYPGHNLAMHQDRHLHPLPDSEAASP